MNFKAGDIVRCIKPNNPAGQHYIVVSPKGMFEGQMLTERLDECKGVLCKVWNVEKKYFAHVQQKAVIV